MKLNRQYWIWGGAAVVGAIVVLAVWLGMRDVPAASEVAACRDFSEGTVVVGETTIGVALADTEMERIEGLTGCETLPEMTGMYFVYEKPLTPRFWMKGMLIPLDIVWIHNGVVVGLEENVPPVDESEPRPAIYQSAQQVDGVLEVAAGRAATYGLVEGAVVKLETRK